MAAITTALTANTKSVTFNRNQDRPLDPIQVLRVNVNTNTAGTGAGDSESLDVITTLPRGYAYRVMNYSCTFYGMTSAELAAWSNASLIEIQNDGVSTQYAMCEFLPGLATVATSSGYLLQHSTPYGQAAPLFQLIDAVSVASQSSGLSLHWKIANTTASVGAVSLNVASTILQYDSESVFEADIWKFGNLFV